MIALAATLLALAPPPLPEPLSKALASLPTDPAGTNNDTHYLVSNERRPDLFGVRPGPDPGGVHIGVGAEQNYVLAGWLRPELVVLLDFDPMVGELHQVHMAFMSEAETPGEYLALWSAPEDAQHRLIVEWLREGRGSGPEPNGIRNGAADRAISALAAGRAEVQGQLATLARMPPGGRATYVTDAEQYRFVRDLVLAGRVVAVQGDLTGAGAMPALATALSDSGLLVRTLYLSNAEQYFMYTARFRENIRALPMDPDTVVLRTLPGRPRDFEYMTQTGLGFKAWLASPKTRSVYAIRGLKRGDHLVGETSYRLRDR